jgi:hypothetical protein
MFIFNSTILKLWNEIIKNDKLNFLLNAFVKIILSQSIDIEIVFDFESDTIVRIDPEEHDTVGLCKNDRISIAGKRDFNAVLGTLVHELTHFVVNGVFSNNFLPFYTSDPLTKSEFEEIVDEFLDENGNFKYNDDGCNGIIKTVYDSYDDHDYIVELIVRVPEIYAYYKNDPRKIDELREKYESLFKIYESYVTQEIEDFINAV